MAGLSWDSLFRAEAAPWDLRIISMTCDEPCPFDAGRPDRSRAAVMEKRVRGQAGEDRAFIDAVSALDFDNGGDE